MRNLIKKILKESTDPDWAWLDEIPPIIDGWDLYHNKLKGESFTINLKSEVMTDDCVDEYFPDDVDYESEVKVILVEVVPKMRVKTNGCYTKEVEVLLLKFYESTNGHDGISDNFSGEKNGEIANMCDNRCWWVYPGLINVNY
jgi:hypothetical protein